MTHKPLISFDYAIKYLLKEKRDYEIVEGFISALLQSHGYKSVKIIALLGSESNKDNKKSKRSLADVVVEDEDHHKYIIEIERNVKEGYVHKACFNTSRLIVDHIAEGEDYSEIIKVFHISLLYFPVGNGALYHGKTVIHEMETKERLTVHITNKENEANSVDATDIFPEYFFISIPQFNDRLENEMDDWLYIMKHDEVPENFHSPYMKKVADKLSVLEMTDEERAKYSKYRRKLIDDREELKYAINKGRQEGKEEGKAEGIEQVAKNMLADNEPLEKIVRYTVWSQKQVQSLQ